MPDELFVEGDPIADTKAPEGLIGDRWEQRRFSAKLVNPSNRRKLTVIVVGTGLAGLTAAVRLAQSRQITPAANERLLDGVGRAVVVAQDQSSQPVHGVDGFGHEDVVCIPIPVPRPSHQLGSGHWSLVSMSAALAGGRAPYWRDAGPNGSKIRGRESKRGRRRDAGRDEDRAAMYEAVDGYV